MQCRVDDRSVRRSTAPTTCAATARKLRIGCHREKLSNGQHDVPHTERWAFVLPFGIGPAEPDVMHDLNDIQYFAAVVEHLGFSAAARALNLPKSSVSRRISALETRLGVRLLERSTRSLRLTEVGAAFYDRCRAILADLGTAEREVAVTRAEPVGLVRMSCPTGLAQFVLAKKLPDFMARYPKVRLQVLATNRTIDLVEDNVDIAIRARVRLDDEASTMRMLYKSELIFAASPAFATANRRSVRIETLSSLPFFSFLEEPARPTWVLSGPNGATKTLSFDPILRSGDFNTLLKVTAAGLGIALLPSEIVEDDIRAKHLIRILPDWHSDEVTVHLLFATNRGIVPAARVLIDYLAEHFKFRYEEDFKKKKHGTTRSEKPQPHRAPLLPPQELAAPGNTIRPFGQKLSRRTRSHRDRYRVDLNESST
jgi:DNA-binding transcriptional LysR family regulator